jgi:hypothetical protein
MNRRDFNLMAYSLAGVLAMGAWAVAAEGKIVTVDPAQAGPDYPVQGEYVGKAGDQKLGAQVIALGNGTFAAVFLPGGLPGDGWDGKTRTRVEGKTEGAETHFGKTDSGWRGAISGEKLAGQTDEGKEFHLKKVNRKSPTLGKKAPKEARVLFDGGNTDAWVNPRVTEDKLLQEGTQTKDNFRDFTLHVEFMTPFMPSDRGQGRGNSGVFLDGRYEVQVLDSFGLQEESHECAAVYSIKAPDVNMSYPPLAWQTYDIDFTAPQFDAGGQKTKNAFVTVRHNGVLVQDHVEVPHTTGGAQEGPELGPIQCMNHGNPVRFRNIWIIEKK